ncbi:MAG: SurA N-terminal domain-containing protein [Hyphomicrobiaceae bacterium]
MKNFSTTKLSNMTANPQIKQKSIAIQLAKWTLDDAIIWLLSIAIVVAGIFVSAQVASAAPKSKKRTQAIVALVNDEPVTSYAVRLRQNLMGLGNKNIGERAKANFQRLLKGSNVKTDLQAILKKTIEANKGKSRDEIIAIFDKRKLAYAKRLQKRAVSSARSSVLSGLRKKALDELIDERLKLQEAKRLNLLAPDDNVNKAIKSMAERNKMDEKKFARYLKSIGTDIYTLREKVKASMSWSSVIRRQFGRQAHLSSRDIDRWRDKNVATVSAPDAKASLKLQRVTFALAGKFKDADFAQLLKRADSLRKRHKSCNSTPGLVKSVSGARFEDLGTRPAGSIAEPTRTMLLNAQPGEMLPASVAAGGVELWILCDRTAAGGATAGPGPSASAGASSAGDKEKKREFDLLSQRHLKDIRQDAHIEYR